MRQIVAEWVTYLREEKLWSHDDPLFPSTSVVLGTTQHYEVEGLKREHWRTTKSIRTIFREAFTKAGLPYYNPHSFRHTLALLGETVCHKTEEFKAWSQNLGHDGVLTTFLSYGEVSKRRQGEIIEHLRSPQHSTQTDVEKIAKAVAHELRNSKTEV